MSLSGSWARRPFSWWSHRNADVSPPRSTGTSRSRMTSRHIRLRSRAVMRHFKQWEEELAAREGTLTTVVGELVVEVTHPPIEQIATHLRRLRAVIDAMPPDVSFIRWEGVTRAYDDYLWLACRELGVPTDLVTIGFGRQRDEERARLENVLREAGLPVR